MGGWWGWSLGSSGTAVCCVSWKVWWLKDWVHGAGHSPVCQILLQIVVRAVITSSPPAWINSAGMLLTPADFPFFNNCTAAFTSLRRMMWLSSVCVWGQISPDGSSLALWLYNSEQYFVHQFSICHSPVRRFHGETWTAFAFPCFPVVKSFASWYALLLLFFLKLSSISLHCSPIQFSSALLMHLLMLLLTSLYFSDASSSIFSFFLSSVLLLQRSTMSAVIQGFFFWPSSLRI